LRDKPPAGFSTYKSTTILLSTVKAKNTTVLMPFRDNHAKCTHCHKVEARPDVKQVQAIAAVVAAGLDAATLRTEQLNNQDIGPFLVEIETRQHPERKDITGHSPTYKSYWPQWKSLAVKNSILECHWESANG
jgi:hypothetical protein